MHQVGEVRESAPERDRKPVAHGLAEPRLVLYVVRQMREGVSLSHAPVVGDGLVAARERNRLEGAERNFLRIIECELDDPAHLLVVDYVHDSGNRYDIEAVRVQITDSAQLDVE